ncbi:glycosyltransferase family 2 protein [Acinetobacter gerneri]|uniref:Glycosyltransferase 2-like domain-containing protein n=1 Tax=Acinetobacter gerneri DSM 14967 = CIP 107464 = MTCC 9824 TaxID=1120926 RepID=N8YDS6_9GAMM|nr:glycosyltransferase family 2 protein [Acinetobacter gerneri]ENV34771.1 hypothetical protein F960_01079 [Acinetobacter gerneri DSM 14967 = CIP 107464 = MTCC 9824]EPR80525.1 hypothetical protein L289_0488 [Acinetobacter gerneri DSM 14967 = CIP 107464 = MTCC 9824]
MDKSISVIIPCFNSVKTIERCLLSVFNQSILPDEIICIDDGSSDSTLILLEKIRLNCDKNISFKILKQANLGPSSARNNGAKLASSKYLAFLDSDDVWHPQKLEISIFFLLEYNLDFLFHQYDSTSIAEYEKYNISNLSIKSLKKSRFMFKNYIATPTVILCKELFVPFPENLSYCEDYCCWILNNHNDYFYFVDLPLSNGFKKPIGEAGLSSNIYKMHRGFLDALKYLLQVKKISLSFYIIAFIFEYLKYPLRYFR